MYCHKVREFLAQKGVEFQEKDVSKDETALNELEELGYAATPVTLVDGEGVVGFDRRRIEELLKE
jgi:glutaredoxin